MDSTRHDGDSLPQRAGRRAAMRGGYMASILSEYRELRQMTDEQVASELGCSVNRLERLALCREPRRQQPRFSQDIQELAAYCGADAGRLAGVLRTVDGLRALAKHRDSDDGGMLAAARDEDG